MKLCDMKVIYFCPWKVLVQGGEDVLIHTQGSINSDRSSMFGSSHYSEGDLSLTSTGIKSPTINISIVGWMTLYLSVRAGPVPNLDGNLDFHSLVCHMLFCCPLYI